MQKVLYTAQNACLRVGCAKSALYSKKCTLESTSVIYKSCSHYNILTHMYVMELIANLTLYQHHVPYFLDGLSSPVVKILLASFRQLCGLLWFLHTRDQASALLRKLQPSLSKVSSSVRGEKCSLILKLMT